MIGKHEVPDRSSEKPALPEVILVDITVLPNRDARPWRGHVAAIPKLTRWPAVLALALLLAILAIGVAVPGDRHGGRHLGRPLTREPGPEGVAAAYGFPLRCLSITIVGTGQRYARAAFRRISPCGRFVGYSTAIFLRVMGAWRPVLEAVGYACPVASLPVDVQTGLGVCPLPGGRAPRPRLR